MTLPVILCECELRSLALKEERRSTAFESEVSRKVIELKQSERSRRREKEAY